MGVNDCVTSSPNLILQLTFVALIAFFAVVEGRDLLEVVLVLFSLPLLTYIIIITTLPFASDIIAKLCELLIFLYLFLIEIWC